MTAIDTQHPIFKEGLIEADGFYVRYAQAGNGTPLVHLHGGEGMRLTRAHDLLAEHFRVIALEMPGFGQSPENSRTTTLTELATTMAIAVQKLGIDRFNLLGTSFGAEVALLLAMQHVDRVLGLVLEAPAAIRPPGHEQPSASEHEMPPVDPVVQAKMRRLVSRLRGPDRDPDLETRMRALPTPTLVLFGTLDRVIPPEMGRFYKDLIRNCHLVFVYDAGHAISAERPEAFAEVTLDFFERHEAFVINRTKSLIHP